MMKTKFEFLEVAEKAFSNFSETDRKDIISYLVAKFLIEVDSITNISDKNTIKYSREGDAFNFHAHFSDEIGEKVAETMVGVASQKYLTGTNTPIIRKNENIEEAVVIGETAEKPLQKNTQPVPTFDSIARKSIVGSEKEWLLVFGFIQSENGTGHFSEDEIKELYKTRIKGNNFKYNFDKLSKEGLIDDIGEGLFLTVQGLDLASEILKRSPGSFSSATKKGKSASRPTSSPSAPSKPPTSKQILEIDGNLNLKGGHGKVSFNEFVNQLKEIKADIQFNVVAVYYLQKILEVSAVGKRQIYTCYKEARRAFPDNFSQSVSRSSGKGYSFLNRNGNAYVLTTRGENLIEHDLKKQ